VLISLIRRGSGEVAQPMGFASGTGVSGGVVTGVGFSAVVEQSRGEPGVVVDLPVGLLHRLALPSTSRFLLRVAGSPVAVTPLTAVTLSWAAWRLLNPMPVIAGSLVLAGALVGVRIRWPSFFERRGRARTGRPTRRAPDPGRTGSYWVPLLRYGLGVCRFCRCHAKH
jgi:hypothetical protein